IRHRLLPSFPTRRSSDLHEGEVGPLTDQQRDFLGNVLTSSRHLLRLINDVLDLAKVESGKLDFRPESIDLAQVTGEVGAILRTRSEEHTSELQSRGHRVC